MIAAKVAIVSTTLLLGACGFTPFSDSIRSAVKDYGAQAYDEGLDNSEFFICKAASVGSVIRKYGGDKSDAWNKLCLEDGQGIVK